MSLRGPTRFCFGHRDAGIAAGDGECIDSGPKAHIQKQLSEILATLLPRAGPVVICEKLGAANLRRGLFSTSGRQAARYRTPPGARFFVYSLCWLVLFLGLRAQLAPYGTFLVHKANAVVALKKIESCKLAIQPVNSFKPLLYLTDLSFTQMAMNSPPRAERLTAEAPPTHRTLFEVHRFLYLPPPV